MSTDQEVSDIYVGPNMERERTVAVLYGQTGVLVSQANPVQIFLDIDGSELLATHGPIEGTQYTLWYLMKERGRHCSDNLVFRGRSGLHYVFSE